MTIVLTKFWLKGFRETHMMCPACSEKDPYFPLTHAQTSFMLLMSLRPRRYNLTNMLFHRQDRKDTEEPTTRLNKSTAMDHPVQAPPCCCCPPTMPFKRFKIHKVVVKENTMSEWVAEGRIALRSWSASETSAAGGYLQRVKE